MWLVHRKLKSGKEKEKRLSFQPVDIIVVGAAAGRAVT